MILEDNVLNGLIVSNRLVGRDGFDKEPTGGWRPRRTKLDVGGMLEDRNSLSSQKRISLFDMYLISRRSPWQC